jgi:hypothetical protein
MFHVERVEQPARVGRLTAQMTRGRASAIVRSATRKHRSGIAIGSASENGRRRGSGRARAWLSRRPHGVNHHEAARGALLL